MTVEKRRKVTREEVIAARTAEGGWTREALAEFGVPWPPPVGWFEKLILHGVPYKLDPLERRKKI